MLNLLTACKPGTSKDIYSASFDQLHQELMELHDSAMIRHGISLRLIDQVVQKNTESTVQNSGSLDSIRMELDRINEAMMDWMADFNDPVTRDSSAVNYLKDQLSQMTAIARNQTSAISGAQNILEVKK